MKKTTWIILVCVTTSVLILLFVCIQTKLSTSKVVAKLTYTKEGSSSSIFYYMVDTTYHHAPISDAAFLNTDAFSAVFDPYKAESTKEMTILDWNGCLYVLAERSYLCWTVDPKTSYILEYDPAAVTDAEIIRMAQSVEPVTS